MYVIILNGIGENSIFSVPQDVFEWVTDSDYHGVPDPKTGIWEDNAVPASILPTPEEGGVYLVPSSYRNDRALHAEEAAIRFFATEREMVEYAHAEGLTITDEYRGYIY